VDEERQLQQELADCKSDVAYLQKLTARTAIFFDMLRFINLAQLTLALLSLFSSASHLTRNTILLWRGKGRQPYTFMDDSSYLLTSLVGHAALALILLDLFRLLLWWMRWLNGRLLLRYAIIVSEVFLFLLGLLTLLLSVAFDYSGSGLLTLLAVGTNFLLEYLMYNLFKGARLNQLRYVTVVRKLELEEEKDAAKNKDLSPPLPSTAETGAWENSEYQKALARDFMARNPTKGKK